MYLTVMELRSQDEVSPNLVLYCFSVIDVFLIHSIILVYFTEALRYERCSSKHAPVDGIIYTEEVGHI